MAVRRLRNAEWGFATNCFVCEPANPQGLGVAFEHDDAAGLVQARFNLGAPYSGAPAYVHGGVVLALLDEAMAWATIAIGGRFATTHQTSARFLRPVRLGRDHRVAAWLVEVAPERFRAAARVEDDGGAACVEADASFAVLSAATARHAIGVEARGEDARFLGRSPEGWRGEPSDRVDPMSEHSAEDMKGRAKEAAGDLTGDEDLQREGKADQTSAKAKEKLEGVVDAVKERFRKD